MDDEATKLLRELRDIALRGEARTQALIAHQKRAMIICFVVLAIALGGLAYALSFLHARYADLQGDADQSAGAAAQ